jgi:hypothetical protein
MRVDRLMAKLKMHPADGEVKIREGEVLLEYPNNGSMLVLIAGPCQRGTGKAHVFCEVHAAPMVETTKVCAIAWPVSDG